MPPAAPSFDGGSENHEKHRAIAKRMSGSSGFAHSVQYYRRLRRAKPEIRKNVELSDLRIARKLRNAESCDDENSDGASETTPKRKRVITEQMFHDGDQNLALSGAEEDSEEIDYADFSSDDDRSSIESSHDDEDVPPGLQRKKKFYIVQNDGRPAELYRTDLIHRLRNGEDSSEDSDEECGTGNGLLRLTDRWREEWNHGVQVPLNAKNLPEFPTESCDIPAVVRNEWSMPSKYIGIQPNSSSKYSSSASETRSLVTLPHIRLYEGDRMDELWLERLNKARSHMNKSPVDMLTFLSIMDTLEFDCYKHIHQLLLEPLHSPNTKIDQVDEEAACDICRISECEYDDEMVFCDGCNLCVHMSCYGLSDLPPDEWLCMKCALCFGNNPPCILCPTTGGALKCTKGMDRWAHVVCALWIPECRFGDYEKREPITNIEEIADERWQLKCSICDTRQGACIQCSVKSCHSAFHVTCALRSGLEMRIEQDPADDGVRMVSLCSRHRTAEPFAEIDELEPNQTASDDEYDVKGSEALRRLESNFYLYVEYEKISERLSLDPLVVSDVYEYWKLKRMDAGGKPLIRNPQDEIKIEIDQPPALTLQLPSPSHQGFSTRTRNCSIEVPNSMFAKWSLQSGRIIRSLDMGRNLMTLVLRREKERQRLVEIELAMIRNIWDQTLSPAPLSRRAVVGMMEVLQAELDVDNLEQPLVKEKTLMTGCPRSTSSEYISEPNAFHEISSLVSVPNKVANLEQHNLRNKNSAHPIESIRFGRKQPLPNPSKLHSQTNTPIPPTRSRASFNFSQISPINMSTRRRGDSSRLMQISKRLPRSGRCPRRSPRLFIN